MKDIKTYIDESIFSGSKDVVKSTEDVLKQEAVDELLQYAFPAKSAKSLMRVELGTEGYEINCTNPYILNISGIPAEGLKYKISKFTGKKLNLVSLGGSDLTKIFTPDCEFNGNLSISWSNYLTSLEGCPEKVNNFECSINPNLNSIEGAPRECKTFSWGDNGKGSKEKPKKGTEPTKENIRKYLKSKSTVIDLY